RAHPRSPTLGRVPAVRVRARCRHAPGRLPVRVVPRSYRSTDSSRTGIPGRASPTQCLPTQRSPRHSAVADRLHADRLRAGLRGDRVGGGRFPDIYLAAGIGGGGALLVISQPRFGRLADRYGRTRMMNIGVAGFVGVMVTASLLVAFGPLPELLAALVVCVLAALAYGPAALAALADLAFALSRGTTMAIYSLTISLGMILGLVLGTQLVDRFGNDGYYLFFGGIAVALVAISAFRYWEVRLGPPAQPTTPAQ